MGRKINLEDYKNKNILITGGLGFLGSNLAHQLCSFGAKVTILDNLAPMYGGNLQNIEAIKEKVEFIRGDIRDFRLIEQSTQGKDIIFNFAGQVSYIDSINIPFEDLDINCKGHLTVLDACRHNNPKARILFSSSRMVLGKITSNPVDENHDTEPLSIYGIHKLTAEKYYKAYNQTYGLDTVILRISNPYGIRQQMKHSKYSLVGWFLRQAMEDQKITVFGEGNQLRDYIYVDDIVDAFLRAGLCPDLKGHVLNIGNGESTAFREMIEQIIQVVGKGRLETVPWPKDYEKIETGDFTFDISKAKRLLDWHPAISMKEGLSRMLDFYEKNQKHYWD